MYVNGLKIAETVNFELLPLKYVNIIVELKHNSPVKIYVNGTKLSLTTNNNLTRPSSISDLNLPYVSFEKFMYNQNTESPHYARNHTSALWFSDYKVLDLSLDTDYSLDQDLNVFMKAGPLTNITLAKMLHMEADLNIFNIDKKEWLVLNNTQCNKKVFLGRTVHTWNDTFKDILPNFKTVPPYYYSSKDNNTNAIFRLYSPIGREKHTAIVKYPINQANRLTIRFNINIPGKIKYKLYMINHNGFSRVEVNYDNTGGYVLHQLFESHDLSEQAVEVMFRPITNLNPNDPLPFKTFDHFDYPNSSYVFLANRSFQLILEVERDY
jgi:hypothetical protein